MGPALSFTERVAVSSLFLHRISVVHVNLSCLIHNAVDTVDTVGQCPHQLKDEIAKTDYRISKTNLLTRKIELYFAVYKLHTYD